MSVYFKILLASVLAVVVSTLSPVNHPDLLQLLIGLTVRQGVGSPVLITTELQSNGSTNVLPDTLADSTSNDTQSCLGKIGNYCQTDVSFKFCNNATAPLHVVTCPPHLPFCSAGRCQQYSVNSQMMSAQPTGNSSAFMCTAEGYFPHPFDCARFYYCLEAGTAHVPEEYQCPSTFAYNSYTKNCQKQSQTACRPIDCSNKERHFVTYAPNPHYYAYCHNNHPTTISTTIFKCSNAVMVYDLTRFECVYKCSGEGYFADPDDVTKYFFCYRDGGPTLQNIHETCPPFYRFTNGKCSKFQPKDVIPE